MGTIPAQLVESELSRFWRHVDRTGDCWLWAGDKNQHGYGRFWLRGRKHAAHRVSFVLAGNQLHEGKHLDHLCRVRSCVNPAHLEEVTPAVNAQRGLTGQATGAKNAAKTHCRNGHAYSPENTYVRGNGGRECIACRVKASREYQRRRRQEKKDGLACMVLRVTELPVEAGGKDHAE